ncbi:membrane protein [Irregularibacter muris]|uniref:Membrane protein n=1 Tax=Irregularibacter muris TaxID=1796619 RepID=A0AAE3KYX7_9FIRM|nr:membrane protein [Irregularibacter muris]
MENQNSIIKKMMVLNIGFFLCALGMMMMLYAGLGAGPWETFHQGLSVFTGLSFGRVSQVAGLAIILGGVFLGIIPGIGSILNMILIGLYADIIESLGLFSTPSSLVLQLLLLFVGMVVNCMGIYVYLLNGLGAGPRDGIMIGLVKKTNLSVTFIKSSIEVTALLIGILLGGPYGIGTIIAALGMGYILDRIFLMMRFDPKKVHQRTLKEEWESIKGHKEKERIGQ